eukprot:NODE_1050_length_2449_cov_1.392766.p1 type:complete len:459 gc:universal NODE_1050_length_2449_cov_1.392766:1930-554(-)
MSHKEEFSATFSRQLSEYLHKDLPDENNNPFYGLKHKLHDLEGQKKSAQKQISDLETQLAELRKELQDQLKNNSADKSFKKNDSVFDIRLSNLEGKTEQPTDMLVQIEDNSYEAENYLQSESLDVEVPSTRLSKDFDNLENKSNGPNIEKFQVQDTKDSNEDQFAASIDEYVFKTHEEITHPINSKLFNSTVQIEENVHVEETVSSDNSTISPVKTLNQRKSVTIAKESVAIEVSPKTQSHGTMTSILTKDSKIKSRENLNHEPSLQHGVESIDPSLEITALPTIKSSPKSPAKLNSRNIKYTNDKPPFLLGTTPTTYSINALLQQKRSQGKLSPMRIPDTLTSTARKSYNTELKHPKEENSLKRVILGLNNERIVLVKYSRDVTLLKLKVFKPGKLVRQSVEHLYSEFNTQDAPIQQRLLELKSRVRRVTAQPALERIIQKEFGYFFEVFSSNLGLL